MKTLNFVLVVFTLAVGCVELPHDLSTQDGFNQRMVPKSFTPPSAEMLDGTDGWRYVGPLEVGGETLVGQADEFVAYDARLSAGETLTLNAWSSGWASLQVFGTLQDDEDWEEITANVLSSPVPAQAEAGEGVFEAPYTGHYLFLVGPVMVEEVDYLLRVDCVEGCDD